MGGQIARHLLAAYVNANQSVPHSRDDIVLYGSQGRVLGLSLSRPGRDGKLSLITPDGEAAGPDPHGPYEYPEGCVVFASFRGLSPRHRYQGSPAGEI